MSRQHQARCSSWVLLMIIVWCFNGCCSVCPSEAGIDGCTSCYNPDVECINCGNGWWWTEDYECIECPEHCSVCAVEEGDSEETTCIACAEGFYRTENGTCEYCIGHCSQCADDNSCATCNDGYLNQKVEPIKCQDCSPGCSLCLDALPTSCYECQTGYYYSPLTNTSGSCIDCGLRCHHCKNGEICDVCDIGYTRLGSGCTACIDHCDDAFCTTDSGCDQCEQGYFLTDDHLQCKSCEFCTSCPLFGGCTSCITGYVLNSDGTCHVCPDVNNIANCDVCGTASRGRIIDENGECNYCPDHCIDCDAVGECNECMDGYFLINDACQACDISCVTCHGASDHQCDSCEPGFGLVDGACTDCPSATGTPHCYRCTGDECTACDEDFFLSPTATDPAVGCVPCSDEDLSHSAAKCSLCAPRGRGRYLSGAQCADCSQFGSRCLECNNDECLLCEDIFYYSEDLRSCAPCTSDHCKRCADSGTDQCLECIDEYYLQDGACHRCPENCKSCPDPNSCNECNDNYYSTGYTVCQLCAVPNCKQCEDDFNVCDQCNATYALLDDGSCEPCAVENCYFCDANRLLCQYCFEGYAYDTNENLCVPCKTGCRECRDESTSAVADAGLGLSEWDVACGNCERGWGRATRVTCFACKDPHCTDCMPDKDVCDACEDGWFEFNEDCAPCDATVSHCSTCTTTHTMCTGCVSGYHLDGNVCRDCGQVHQQCTECTGEGATDCTMCADGWYQTGGTCEACHSSCATCDGPNVDDCTDCHGSDYLDTDTCYDCSLVHSACEECSGETASTDCTMCADGYWQNSGDCSACTAVHAQCIACNNITPGSCTMCADGWYETGGDCMQCDASCGTCTGAGPSACDGCSGDHHLNINECLDCSTVHAQCTECIGLTVDTDCSTCGVGYYQSGGSCLACDLTMCADCSGTATQCTACDAGLHLHSMACIDCTKVHPQCTECTGSDNDLCTECAAGWLLNTEGTCIPESLIENCETITSPTGCTQCLPGFFSYEVETCVEGLYEDCSRHYQGGVCWSCDRGYRLDDYNRCIACPENCDDCDADLACTRCLYGYYLDGADQTCKRIELEGCGRIRTFGTCTSCMDGYLSEHRACLRCPDHCYDCDYPWICDYGCQFGWGHAEPCAQCDDSDCKRCSSEFVCEECNDGMYVDPVTRTCEDCDNGCLHCTVSECYECEADFELQEEGSCMARTNSPLPNCEYDNGPDCTKCDENYFLDPNSGHCIHCATRNPDHAKYACDQCKSLNGLNRWQQHWSAECLDCPENCVRCSSLDTCDECTDGMYTDGIGCFDLVCNDISVIDNEHWCSACSLIHYYSTTEYRTLVWTGGECSECPKNCERCTSTTACDDCREGHVWSVADALCVTCNYDEASECVSCGSVTRGRYVPGDMQCLMCDEECTSCEGDSSHCTSCSATHYLHDHSCLPCSDVILSQEGCAECQVHYAPWSNNVHAWMLDAAAAAAAGGGANQVQEDVFQCLECAPGCQSCVDQTSCDDCGSGSYFYKDSSANTYECTSCITNCISCTGPSSCQLCASGYYYVNTDLTGPQCAVCPAHCTNCHHYDGCLQCADSYYLDGDRVCQLCSTTISNCISCELQDNSLQCKDCSSQFYLTTPPGDDPNEQCVACQENCLECVDESDCLVCAVNYCYDPSAKLCRANGDKQCSTCELRNEEVSCLTCETNTFLHLCQTCEDIHCISCPNSLDVCTVCDDGYYVGTDGSCEACLENCLSCSDEDTCDTDSCALGTFWNQADAECTECPSLCAECSDASTCDRCVFDNMYIDTEADPHQCTFCYSGCASCNDTMECNSCLNGYRAELYDETEIIRCSACPSNCLACDMVGQRVECFECDERSTLSSAGSCMLCADFAHCVSCGDYNENDRVDVGDCDVCEPGFFLTEDGSQCSRCDLDGCLQCRDRDYICEECEDDLNLSEDQHLCGTPCWVCVDNEECSSAPQLNETTSRGGSPTPADGSAYSSVGCSNGCWVIRNDTAGVTTYTRGCNYDLDCSSYDEEDCNTFGEDEEKSVECYLCCDEEYCNTQTLTGMDAGAASYMNLYAHPALLCTVILLLCDVLVVYTG